MNLYPPAPTRHSEPRSTGMIDNTMEQLFIGIKRLQEEISTMEIRLDPVLIPQAPVAVQSSTADRVHSVAAPTSPLHNQLLDMSASLDDLINRLGEIRNRVTL